MALHEDMDGCTWALKSDRAYVLDYRIAQRDGSLWLLSRGLWNRNISEYLSGMKVLIAISESWSTYRQAEPTLRQTLGGGWAVLFNCMTRTCARSRSLRVLNALQTHVPTTGHEVPKLSELGLPAQATIDPYTGEPLHVKKTPQGWVVYSVGKNLKDDGGKLDESETGDVGVGPRPPEAEQPHEK